MAKALFIGNKDLVRNTIIDGNVDVNKFKQFIKLAQDIHIQNYLGTDLYDKLQALILAGELNETDNPDYLTLVNEYLKPMLIHFAMVDYIPFSAYQIANGGVFKHSSENSETASKQEVDYLIERHRSFAEFYTRRFIDFMVYNQSKYPEYYSNSEDDMYPDRNANFSGWVL
jgi:hypothetical protein